jgi:hypothetical protein
VHGSRDLPAGAVDRDAYVLRVLEQFRAAPRRRDVYAAPSPWRADPRAMVLDGVAWEAVRTEILTGPGLAVTAGSTCGTWTGYLDACHPCCPGPLVLGAGPAGLGRGAAGGQACDVGLTPAVKPGVPALTPDRLPSTGSAASCDRHTGKARKTSSACSAWRSTPRC